MGCLFFSYRIIKGEFMGNNIADVLLHNSSYGRDFGYFEAMGEICNLEIQAVDYVEATKTTEDVIDRAKKIFYQ